ncbi:DUF1049 domain-containing protein [Cylindrospermopsis raciborskii S07]|uniref:DUF1049 domain-containing protein n=2 Tax=Cylindrospermopsis raciborskii TaxID=77022 RepID=A0A853MLV8_9CYAN|nr:hypothetical protein [Cylindrospermopsis raciborskii]EFA71335.1 conserved hypothetical protein [Cylindrospermopsis raciborskii CS-505]MBA4445758.1 DUF1049 domain-containing protein [Cylindrospermopsis raciborskii CS-506_C]MBA4449995.1 DUF1049 domain-containing protein [Cylindrospermopsis raciborskii CS-506_D]MBA4456605.1 DUF1049 domain-containing protein [Cylindrospermopsis raciborskii CS-506_B]MBA4465965.1 DUF1049 domain-containing protein [Cylindrospermopsis raciborskii CS-506_A]
MTPQLLFNSSTMKNLPSLFTLFLSVVLATWILAIALISVQNATPISLRFLVFQSIQVPFGLMLAFWVVVGLITVSFGQLLGNMGESGNSTDEEGDFFVDEDFR